MIKTKNVTKMFLKRNIIVTFFAYFYDIIIKISEPKIWLSRLIRKRGKESDKNGTKETIKNQI